MIIMLKKCKLCNKQFEPSHFNAKYCSDECRKAAQKQQINDWKKSHPNYFKEWHDANPTYQNRYGNSAAKIFNKEFINLLQSNDYSLDDIPKAYRSREEETPGYTKCIGDMYLNTNFTCEITGKRGNAVHHLNAYHWDTDGRCDYSNMIVLNNSVHRFFHFLYGYENNTKEQFDEFLNLHFCSSIDNILNCRSDIIWS